MTSPLSHPHEQWHRIDFGIDSLRYEVSNFGRLKSFSGSPKGKIICGSVINGYPSINVRASGGKSITLYVHNLVANYFVEKSTPERKYVMHIDMDKGNARADNLKWVTKYEIAERLIATRKKGIRTKNYKLTEAKVRVIKRLLRNENNRFVMIAKQFGVSHTQINRIRSGENWKQVTVE